MSASAEFEPGVPMLTQGLVTGGGFVTALLLVSVPVAALLALVGAVAWTSAVRRHSQRYLDGGAGIVALALVTAGLVGVEPPVLVLASGAAFVTYDLASTGLSLATQVGTLAETRQGELARLGVTAIGAAVVAGVGYVAFTLASGSVPPAAVALIFGGVLLAGLALR
ncbi:DUF7519 family protein [Halosegnis longus]|uniref:DUF7519 family protein n=1 Tax=Halosegnis longus TaxID=2216012 RepID=UPI00117EC470|nr:hypothetical protein [Salella cibi]